METGREFQPVTRRVSTSHRLKPEAIPKELAVRTRKLKLQYTQQLDTINAATASVWRECLVLKEMWDYAHGYRTGGALDVPCERNLQSLDWRGFKIARLTVSNET